MVALSGSEFEHSRNIVGLEIGIIGKNFLLIRTSGQEIQDILYPDAKAPYRRPAPANLGIDGDAIEMGHIRFMKAVVQPP